MADIRDTIGLGEDYLLGLLQGHAPLTELVTVEGIYTNTAPPKAKDPRVTIRVLPSSGRDRRYVGRKKIYTEVEFIVSCLTQSGTTALVSQGAEEINVAIDQTSSEQVYLCQRQSPYSATPVIGGLPYIERGGRYKLFIK